MCTRVRNLQNARPGEGEENFAVRARFAPSAPRRQFIGRCACILPDPSSGRKIESSFGLVIADANEGKGRNSPERATLERLIFSQASVYMVYACGVNDTSRANDTISKRHARARARIPRHPNITCPPSNQSESRTRYVISLRVFAVLLNRESTFPPLPPPLVPDRETGHKLMQTWHE